MLGQLTGQDQSDSSLDFSGGDGRLLVVSSQLRCFGGDSLEDIVHKRVQNRHRFLRNTGVRVCLLQNFVDIRRVGFLSDLGLLHLVIRRWSGLLGGWLLLSWSLGGRFLFGFGRHLFVCVYYRLDLLVIQSSEPENCSKNLLFYINSDLKPSDCKPTT